MEFEQIEITGCRVVGALTPLGRIGPKHFGIVLGINTADRQIYFAESTREAGYRLTTYDAFVKAHERFGKIRIRSNHGPYSAVEVAQRALDELMQGGDGRYNLVTNNCESFTNRAMNNHSRSAQVLRTMVGLAAFVGVFILQRYTRRV